MKCKVLDRSKSGDLRTLVKEFTNGRRCGIEEDFKRFRRFGSLDETIREAALCIDSNRKRHRHQTRIKKHSLKMACHRLLQEKSAIAKCATFNELIGLITSVAARTYGIGPLYTYDVSTRIGAYLSLYPGVVYLHAGTREGARAMGLDYRKDYLIIEELPKELQVPKPYEIEDFLCICRDQLRGIFLRKR